MQATIQPYALDRDAGAALGFFGSRTWIKATGAQTGGAYGLVEQLLPPGNESPWHCHHAEDESFYVVEGAVTVLCGDARIEAGPGSFVFAPRGIPHGFRVMEDAPARMLILATPAGFEQFVLALSAPAPRSGFPPAGPPDMEKMMAAAARHHIDILGPLPA